MRTNRSPRISARHGLATVAVLVAAGAAIPAAAAAIPPVAVFTANLNASAAVIRQIDRFNACPVESSPGVFRCAAEYHVGRRWYFAAETITPGDVATLTAATSWVRHWHHDSQACLRSWGLRGNVSSNFPCAADPIAHGSRKAGYVTGTGTGYWPWIYKYPCGTRRGVTTCTNAMGDSYRFRERPVYVGGA